MVISCFLVQIGLFILLIHRLRSNRLGDAGVMELVNGILKLHNEKVTLDLSFIRCTGSKSDFTCSLVSNERKEVFFFFNLLFQALSSAFFFK